MKKSHSLDALFKANCKQALNEAIAWTEAKRKVDFKERMKQAMHEAFGEVWSEVTAQLRDRLDLEFTGYKRCELTVVEGNTGDDWWTINLSRVVTNYLRERVGYCAPDEWDWCEAIAADMEKQAKRLRDHAAKMRPLSEKQLRRRNLKLLGLNRREIDAAMREWKPR